MASSTYITAYHIYEQRSPGMGTRADVKICIKKVSGNKNRLQRTLALFEFLNKCLQVMIQQEMLSAQHHHHQKSNKRTMKT